jgi:hypothetical protein
MRMTCRTVALAVVFSLAALLSAPSVAQQAPPETLSLANELVDEVAADGFVDDLVARTWPAYEKQIRRELETAPAASIAELRSVYIRLVSDNAHELLAGTPALYAKYFDADELRDMLAFYRSPTGRKALRVMPRMGAESLQASMAASPKVIARMDQAFRDILRERGVELPI